MEPVDVLLFFDTMTLGPIQEDVGTDYRYRSTAPSAEVSAAVARIIVDLDYSNFKNEVAEKRGHKRFHLYH